MIIILPGGQEAEVTQFYQQQELAFAPRFELTFTPSGNDWRAGIIKQFSEEGRVYFGFADVNRFQGKKLYNFMPDCFGAWCEVRNINEVMSAGETPSFIRQLFRLELTAREIILSSKESYKW